MLSVLGQRGRPSGVNRLDLLKAVGSRLAKRARADGDRPLLEARASIACQIQSCVNLGGDWFIFEFQIKNAAFEVNGAADGLRPMQTCRRSLQELGRSP